MTAYRNPDFFDCTIGRDNRMVGFRRVHFYDYPGSTLGEHTVTEFHLGPYYSAIHSDRSLCSIVLPLILSLVIVILVIGVRRKKLNPTT
jgi:hypothetical protein